LYTLFLDASVVAGNKELEMRKESYAQMKSWLCDKYGRPACVADLYLENIRRLARPADAADPLAEASYLKAVHSNLVTLVGLENERGVRIRKLEDHIHSNDFLSRLGDALPTGVRDQFIDSLEDTDYSRIQGRQHLQTIIHLLKKAYTKAEATASAAGGLPSAAYFPSPPNTDRVDTAAQSRTGKVETRSARSSGPSTTAVESGARKAVGQFAKPPPAATKPPVTTSRKKSARLEAVLSQFAPAAGPQRTDYSPRNSARTTRWTCPLTGHEGHDLSECREFWGARTCKERRGKMMGAACFCCLGRSQGCTKRGCARLTEVPRDLVCKECALHWRERPNNVLTCAFASHQKPDNQFIISTVEQWIPGLSVAGLGVRTLVNSRSLPDKRVLEAKRRSTEDRTQRQETGGNGKVVLLDRIRGLEAVVQQLRERCPTAGASVPAVEIDPFLPLVIQTGGKRCPTVGASVPAVEIDLPSCHHLETSSNPEFQQSVSQPEKRRCSTQQSASQPEEQRFSTQQSASQPEE
jgi:hypothetical protein